MNDPHIGHAHASTSDIVDATKRALEFLMSAPKETKVFMDGDFETAPGTVFMSHDFYVEVMGINWLPTRHRLIREMRKRNKNK